jgi:phage shock protein E
MFRALVLTTLLFGCKGPSGATVSSAVAHELVAKGAALVDVRTTEEFAASHLPAAINLPIDELETQLAALGPDKGRDIVVYCQSGGRSARAKALLLSQGFSQVHDLGGIKNW